MKIINSIKKFDRKFENKILMKLIDKNIMNKILLMTKR